MRLLKLGAVLAALILLASCTTQVVRPDPETTGTESPADKTPASLPGAWSLGKGNVILVLRGDGTGAILSIGAPDGEIFPELYYVGTAIIWHLSGDRLTLTPQPDILPNGAVCTTAASTEAVLVSFDGETLLLTEASGDNPRTEMFVPTEEPPYMTVAAYAKTLADAKFAAEPEGTDEEAFYTAFYEAFAALYRGAASE